MPTDLMGALTRADAERHNVYFIHIAFRNMVLGAQPKNAQVLAAWQESKQTPPELIAAQMEAMGTDMAQQAGIEANSTGFFRDPETGVPYLGTYTVSAAIREMMTTLGITVELLGIKQTRQHLMEVQGATPAGVALPPKARNQIRFYREDGSPVVAPDGSIESVGHPNGPTGVTAVLKAADYIEGAHCYFLLRVPARLPKARAKAAITDDVLVRVLADMGNNGLGKERSLSHGKYDVVEFSRLTDEPVVVDGKPTADDALPEVTPGKRAKRATPPVAEAK